MRLILAAILWTQTIPNRVPSPLGTSGCPHDTFTLTHNPHYLTLIFYQLPIFTDIPGSRQLQSFTNFKNSHQNRSPRVSITAQPTPLLYSKTNSPTVVWSSGMTSRCGWRTLSVPIQIRASLGSSTFFPNTLVVLRHRLTCLQFPVPPINCDNLFLRFLSS